MDWDRLLKRIEDEDFECSRDTWVSNMINFVNDHMFDLLKTRSDLVRKPLKIAELKTMIKVVFDLPDSVIEMMQANVDKMETAEIEDQIAQYKERYEKIKVQNTSTSGDPSSSTSEPRSETSEPIQVSTTFSAEFYSRLNINTNNPFTRLLNRHYLTSENVHARIDEMSEGQRFNFHREWLISAITFIKILEIELARLQGT